MSKMNKVLTDEQFADVMRSMDEDGSGELEFGEFCHWWQNQVRSLPTRRSNRSTLNHQMGPVCRAVTCCDSAARWGQAGRMRTTAAACRQGGTPVASCRSRLMATGSGGCRAATTSPSGCASGLHCRCCRSAALPPAPTGVCRGKKGAGFSRIKVRCTENMRTGPAAPAPQRALVSSSRSQQSDRQMCLLWDGQVWDIDTGNCVMTLNGHTDLVTSLAALAPRRPPQPGSLAGRRAMTGSEDKTVRVWDLDTGVCEQTFTGHSGQVAAVAVSTEGRHAVSGSEDRTVRVWDLERDRGTLVLQGHTSTVYTGARSKTPTREHCSPLTGALVLRHGFAVAIIGSVASGLRAVSGSRDTTVRVWDLQGSISRRRDCHSAAPPSPFSRCFNRDGRESVSK